MKSRLLISTAALAAAAILCQANAEGVSSPTQSQFHAKSMQLAQERGASPATGGGAAGAAPESKSEGKGGAEHRGAPDKSMQRGMEKGGAEKGAAEKSVPEKGERTRDTQRDIKKDEKSTQKTESRDREKTTNEKSTNKERNSDRASSGKGDAKNVHLDNKQETRVKTVIRNQKVTHIKRTEINFSINVGTRIPASVHWYPVPVEIVEVVPEYRGYYYIIVDEDILIISPATREIVAVIRLA